MPLLEDLIAASGHAGARVSNIVAGPRWTMVTAGASGVAPPLSADTETLEQYRDRPLVDLFGLLSSSGPLAALGAAAINAAIAGERKPGRDRSSPIPRAGGKTVAVIGEFDFIEDLKRIAASVIPVDPQSVAGVEADIAIIRGSTLVEGTLEFWLDRTRSCYSVVYGPSTPLSPVLFDYGADRLVGVSVDVEDVAAAWIDEGRDDLLSCPGIRSVVLSTG
jgi:hypothetical protein